jgi:hypothetical protein
LRERHLATAGATDATTDAPTGGRTDPIVRIVANGPIARIVLTDPSARTGRIGPNEGIESNALLVRLGVENADQMGTRITWRRLYGRSPG